MKRCGVTPGGRSGSSFLTRGPVLPLLVFVVYWSWATFYIAATGVIVFSVISWAGLTVPSTLRMIRRAFVGPYRPAVLPGSAGGSHERDGNGAPQDARHCLCLAGRSSAAQRRRTANPRGGWATAGSCSDS